MPNLNLFLLYWTVISLFFPHSLNPGLSPCLSKQLSSFWNGHWSRLNFLGSDLCGGSQVPSVPCPRGMLGQPTSLHRHNPPPSHLHSSLTPRERIMRTGRGHTTHHRAAIVSELPLRHVSSTHPSDKVRASAGRMRLEFNGHSSNADELLDTCPGDWCCWWLWLLILAL